jgi:ATP-dependent Clp protease ATP-binding subunit ClpA
MDVILNDAVELRAEFNHTAIQPELILLALLRRPNTAASRLLSIFKEQRGLDMARFERQVRLAIQNRRDQNGNQQKSPSQPPVYHHA